MHAHHCAKGGSPKTGNAQCCDVATRAPRILKALSVCCKATMMLNKAAKVGMPRSTWVRHNSPRNVCVHTKKTDPLLGYQSLLPNCLILQHSFHDKDDACRTLGHRQSMQESKKKRSTFSLSKEGVVRTCHFFGTWRDFKKVGVPDFGALPHLRLDEFQRTSTR